MSDMLEQAIVDAESLKEVALKSAENSILEKYSDKIKDAVNLILEQDPAVEEEFPVEEPEIPPTAEPDPALEFLPTTGLEDLETPQGNKPKMCQCPDTEEEGVDVMFSLNVDQLQEELTKEKEKLNLEEEKLKETENLIEELTKELSEKEVSEEQILKELESFEDISEEDLEINDDILDDILEQINLDALVTPTGHIGAYTESELKYASDVQNALDDIKWEKEKKLEKEYKKNKELEKKVLTLEGIVKKVYKRNEDYKHTLESLKEHLNNMNLSNARLLYVNRVIGSDSLNERQKEKIVEAISSAGSIEEAKIIYETLQSAVGSNFINAKKEPKSLSEAVEKRSSVLMPTRRQPKLADNPVSHRWKTLAGIK